MKIISIDTTENNGKTETERLEPESIEKVSSDVSEQHRRVSVITQKNFSPIWPSHWEEKEAKTIPQTVRSLFRDKNTTNTQIFIIIKETKNTFVALLM